MPASYFAPKYAIRNVLKTNLGLDMNGTHQVLSYGDDINLIGDDIRIVKNADVILNACKDIGLAVNTVNTVHGNRSSSRHNSK